MIVAGYASTAAVFSDILSVWHSSPTITTLRSAARPVTELPFPAVVVCPAEDTPPDNSALVQKVVDLMEFRCRTEEEEEGDTSGQDRGCELRQRFRFVLEEIFYRIFLRLSDLAWSSNDTSAPFSLDDVLNKLPADLDKLRHSVRFKQALVGRLEAPVDHGHILHRAVASGVVSPQDLIEANLAAMGKRGV